jgi:hypothetical protein
MPHLICPRLAVLDPIILNFEYKETGTSAKVLRNRFAIIRGYCNSHWIPLLQSVGLDGPGDHMRGFGNARKVAQA